MITELLPPSELGYARKTGYSKIGSFEINSGPPYNDFFSKLAGNDGHITLTLKIGQIYVEKEFHVEGTVSNNSINDWIFWGEIRIGQDIDFKKTVLTFCQKINFRKMLTGAWYFEFIYDITKQKGKIRFFFPWE